VECIQSKAQKHHLLYSQHFQEVNILHYFLLPTDQDRDCPFTPKKLPAKNATIHFHLSPPPLK